MFSLESPHRGNSNKHNSIYHFQNKKIRKSHKIILSLQAGDFSKGAQERVRNSRGKRVISVRATEILL